MKPVAWLVISATLAHAEAPRTLERRRDVEAALLAHERARAPADVLLGAGLVSLTTALVSLVLGTSFALEDVSRVASFRSSRRADEPSRTGEVDALFGVALATGVAGFVSVVTAIVVRQWLAPPARYRELLLERARLERELRVVRKLVAPHVAGDTGSPASTVAGALTRPTEPHFPREEFASRADASACARTNSH